MQPSQARIYLIDDDEKVIDSLALLLKLHGFETLSFRSAEAFLDGYSRDWHGCVLADLGMTGMSGLELQREMQSRGIELPFVMMSGHGDASAARTARDLRAVDFLDKPIDTQQLLTAIHEALRRGREQERKKDQ